MSATNGHAFDEYELRPATAEDLPLAREWTAADPVHDGVIDPPFWTEQGIGVDSYVLTDKDGEVFFLRMERVTRLYIQFGPTQSPEQQRRMRAALGRGLRWLAGALGRCSVREIIFDSQDTLLRRFAIGGLGFRAAQDTLTSRVQIVPTRVELAPIPAEVMESVRAEEAKDRHGVL